MKKILFVCTGNTCRSPMAGALFQKLINEKGLSGKYSCKSAGVYAFEHDPATSEAVEVMKNEYGIDISDHRASVLDFDDIMDAWLILVMTERHRNMILDVFPQAADKLFTLKSFAEVDDENPDISDPFGMDYEVYKNCAAEIETCLMNNCQID